MFHIDCFCEDKHVGAVLRSLASVGAYNVKALPATDAAVKGGKVSSTRVEGLGKSASVVANALNGHTEISTLDIKAVLRRAGLSENNYGNVRNELIEKKVLKAKSRGLFEVRK